MSNYNADVLKEISEMLCDSSRVMIFLMSNDLEDECKKSEHNMLTKYIVKDISGDLLKAIEKPGKLSIGLPPKNILIPTNTEITEFDGDYCNTPQVLESGLYFKQDALFRQPKGIVQLKMFSADIGYGTDPKAIVFAHIWNRVLTRYMAEYLYTATKTGYQFYTEFDSDDFSLLWKGYNEHLPAYVNHVCTNIVQMRKANVQPLFEEARDWLLRDFAGAAMAKPYRQALDLLPKMLEENNHGEALLRGILENYQYENFKEELGNWFLNGHSNWFVHGNFSKDEALALVKGAGSVLALQEAPLDGLA